MTYIIMGWKDGDLFSKEFDNKEEAIKAAEADWNYLTAAEKKDRDFYVLESANPDEDAEDHFDGGIVWRPER